MVKGASMQTSLQHNDWKETEVRWGIERLPMVLLHQLSVVALIFLLSASVVFGTEDTLCKKNGYRASDPRLWRTGRMGRESFIGIPDMGEWATTRHDRRRRRYFLTIAPGWSSGQGSESAEYFAFPS